MTLYQNKYRIESTRLPNYDYAANGCYFVTICTYRKHCYFGTIVNSQMQLSQVGKIAQRHWQEIPNHFDGVYIDEYAIMPNHVHGIIIINKPDRPSRDVVYNVSTDNDDLYQTMSKLSPKPGSLSVIIRSYKSSVTRWCNRNNNNIFRWQPRFYENIIRDERALNNIRKYIINNPAKWSEDKNYVR
jgi:REP element-mobilizing transposase RayT